MDEEIRVAERFAQYVVWSMENGTLLIDEIIEEFLTDCFF